MSINKNIIQQAFFWLNDNSPDLIFILSGNAEILSINKAASIFYNIEPANLIGRNYFDFLKQLGRESVISSADLTKDEVKIVLDKKTTVVAGENQYTFEWSLGSLVNNKKTHAYILVGRKIVGQSTEKKLNVMQDSKVKILQEPTKESPANLKRIRSNDHKNRILIVEDQSVGATVVQHMLNNLGYEADIAPNGQKAIEFTKQHLYDLIFMDIGLPDMDGYEVTKAIRNYETSLGEAKVPIVGLTAHGSSESKQFCLDIGMNAALTKPLLEDAAVGILKAFIPSYDLAPKMAISTEEEKSGIFTSAAKIVDFDFARKVAGVDQEAIEKFLFMFIDNISKDEVKLDRAFYREDWKIVREIIHKLRGSCDYCGAIKLREACIRLEDSIVNGKLELRETLYQQAREEIQALKWFVKSLTNKNS